MRSLFMMSVSLGLAISSPVWAASANLSAPTDPVFSALATPPESGEGKWVGSFGAGFTLSRGNSDATQASLTADATRAMRDSRLLGHALLIRNTANGTRTSDESSFNARGERSFAPTWFGFGDVLVERDRMQDLSLRQSYSSGVGNRLYQEKALSLNLYSGLAYTIENNVVARDARGAEFLFGEDFSYAISDNSKISQRVVMFPHSIGSGGKRYVLQADLTTKIVDHLGLQLAVLNKYREQVTGTDKNTDLTLFTGITASF